jgi:hypothetical protein
MTPSGLPRVRSYSIRPHSGGPLGTILTIHSWELNTQIVQCTPTALAGLYCSSYHVARTVGSSDFHGLICIISSRGFLSTQFMDSHGLRSTGLVLPYWRSFVVVSPTGSVPIVGRLVLSGMPLCRMTIIVCLLVSVLRIMPFAVPPWYSCGLRTAASYCSTFFWCQPASLVLFMRLYRDYS